MFDPYKTERNSPFVIAEIGINHNGNIDLVKRLINIAANANCDAVKFQKRTIDVVYTQEYLEGPRESPWGTTQREQKEGLEFGKEEYDIIDSYCKERGILWSASSWDEQSQEFLRQYNLPFNKIASAMLTHLPLMETIASEGRHTFISTGMSTLHEVETVLRIFERHSCPFTLFHCVSTYPCNDSDCNIATLVTLKEKYNCPVGYSGHEAGILPTIIAVAMGAQAIERHITLDKAMYGSDQSASLEPYELIALVENIREVNTILGTGEKTVLDAEVVIADKLRYFDSANTVTKTTE